MKSATVCMICSAARSGSTVLDLLIGGHSKAASLGEFSFLGKAISLNQPCTCGEPVTTCPSWRRVFDEVKNTHSVDLLRAPYALTQWDTKASTVVDKNYQTKTYLLKRKLRSAQSDVRYSQAASSKLRLPLARCLRLGVTNGFLLYDKVAEVWKKQVVIDSSKNVHKAIAFAEAEPSRTRVIYLTRDGRGVFHSRRTSGFSRKEASDGWRSYNLRAQRLLQRNLPKDGLMHLRYEDLMADSTKLTGEICNFLGIDYEPAMIEIDPTKAHMVNGNDMRLRGKQELKLDERWRRELAGDELEWFLKHNQQLNESLGYN